MTQYEWDAKCVDLELRRVQDGFTRYDHLNFARVLLMAFGTAEADVHRETGSLAESGNANITAATARRWAGEISFGGASFGVKPMVRYAASEFFGESPRYGGPPSHSFYKLLGWSPFGEFSSGVPIWEDMTGPAKSFLERGKNTPHPELGTP